MELNPELRESVKTKIREGETLKILSLLGYSAFRECVIDIPYADILAEQIKQINQLVSQPETAHTWRNKSTEEFILKQSRDACQKVHGTTGLIQKLSSPFTRDKRFERQINPYSFFAYRNTTVNKFIVSGNFYNTTLDQNRQEIGPTIRLYFHTNLATTAELFECLVEKLKNKIIPSRNEPVISYLTLILNLTEFSYRNDTTMYSKNGIILQTNKLCAQYAMPAVAQTIKEMTNETPEIWNLPVPYVIMAKIRVLKDLMIPITTQIGLVEIDESLDSYHTRDLWKIENELKNLPIGQHGEMISQGQFLCDYDDIHTNKQIDNLCALLSYFTQYNAQNTGSFMNIDLRSKRKKYQPALILR